MKRVAWTSLGWLALLSAVQAGQPVVDQEREKAHIVSRMYEATYGAQKQCANHKDELARLNKVIDRFRQAYPELMSLVESSPYFSQTKEAFDSCTKNACTPLSDEDCRFAAGIFQQWLENPDGQQMVNEMVQTLQGNGQAQSPRKTPSQLDYHAEDVGKPQTVIDARPHTPPLFVPFEAQKAGSIYTAELRVVEHRAYQFSLFLKRKKGDTIEDIERLIELAGRSNRDGFGKLIQPGISIPLKLTVSAIESSGERIVYDKEVHEEECVAGGGDGIEKFIDHIALRPGRYRVSIRSLNDIPELAERPIEFAIFARWNTSTLD